MERIGSYNISRLIEEGGVAAVYQGVQESLNRPVAIKVLQHRFSGDDRIVDYFNRESLIIARLNHPNIIHVIDRGLTEDGRPYFVMEFIEGSNAARLIMEGGLTFAKKLDILIQTCKALAYAHKNGVIHRDIKPANILVDKEGNVHVADFGIAQFYDSDSTARPDNKAERLGTPSYMSPEQLHDSRDASFASDIYSLGVVMAEMFTGKRFPKNHDLPSPLAADVTEPLERLIRQCIAPLPENRPASVEAVMTQLFILSQGVHISQDRRQKAMGGVPSMDEIFAVLDIIKETDRNATYLLRHKQKDLLLVAKTFKAMNNGIKAARLLLNLRHDHIAAVQGVSGNKDSHIVVMEYLPGGSLADRMVMPIPFREALRIIKAVCLALQFAHAKRITHGNLKPSNVLFTGTDAVKLADFRMNDEREDTGHDDLPLRIRDDIFSTGILLYTMVIGFPPVFEDNSFVAHKQFKNLPQEVKRLILRLLSRDETVRFQSMKQAADTITSIYGDELDDDKTVVSLDSKLSSGFRNAGKGALSRRTLWRNVGIAAAVMIAVVVLSLVFFR